MQQHPALDVVIDIMRKNRQMTVRGRVFYGAISYNSFQVPSRTHEADIPGNIDLDPAAFDRLRLPHPVQLSRVRGWRMPPNTVSVSRPTIFGNPFLVGHGMSPEMAISLHRTWLEAETAEELGYEGQRAAALNALRAEIMRRLPELRGKNLACWCATPAPYEHDRCHRAVLMEIANR